MEISAKSAITVTLMIFSVIAVNRSLAQGKGASASAASPSNSSSPNGGSGLQGESFTRDTWNTQLRQLPKARDIGFHSDNNIVFVCYRLAAGKNAATPFVLNNIPISPNGDPPQWQPNHVYQASDWVYSSNHNGRYYQAQGAGKSGDKEPDFPSAAGSTTIPDGTAGNLTWKDMGYFGYSPFVSRWTRHTNYSHGSLVILSSVKGHYFELQTVNGGSSGSREPKEKNHLATEESGLVWKDMGDLLSQDKRECATVTSSRPLLMNQDLVVAVDMSDIPENVQERFSILNFNVTSQQAQPINVTPIQPSISAGAASGALGGSAAAGIRSESVPPRKQQIYYLTWPSLVTGDSITAINLNLVYTPVAPALPWKGETFYSAGSIVVPSASAGAGALTTNGHFYQAINSGISDTASPNFASAAAAVPMFREGSGLTWKDMGPTPPPTAPPLWAKNTLYGAGDLIIPPEKTGHYYQAQTHAQSGASAPSFMVATGGETAPDGPNLSWKDMGTVLPVPSPVPWVSGRTYSSGYLITPPTSNGHYYRAQASGKSRSTPPAFHVDGTAVDDGPNLSWTDMGNTALNPVPPMWQANTAYATGAQVTSSQANGHYYQALSAGVTGPNAPPFPVNGTIITETDGLVWVDSGTTPPANAKPKRWAATTPFVINDLIQDLSTGHYYTVIQAGISGAAPPSFSVVVPKTVSEEHNQIAWQDLGTTLPSAISIGQPQPPDQTVSTINYSFPQSHALSYFSLTSGVVLSSIQTRSFLNTSSSSTPKWTTVKNGPIVDPILALTVFAKPIDAERPWHKSDLIPGPTIAFSLTSPSTNFYFGGSSVAFVRNIQLLYGFSAARISVLQAASVQVSSTSPATRQQFAKGAFIGVSFNIVGLITSGKSLF